MATRNIYTKEDFRKEFVTNILIGFVVAEVLFLYFFHLINENAFFVVAVPFMSLYFVSKLGFYRIALFFCLTIIGLALTSTLSNSYLQSLVILFLVTVILYALTGIKTVIIYSLAIATFAFTLPRNEMAQINTIPRYIQIPLVLGVALCVGWLPNQRLRESLRKIKRAEMLLKAEKDLLDIRLRQRTESLYKMADLGISTHRLIHDISTPLNTLLINISKLNQQSLEEATTIISRVQCSTDTMVRYINGVRNKIVNQDQKTWFELKTLLEALVRICETDKVQIKSGKLDHIEIFGNETKFIQMLANIVQNSVESYENKHGIVELQTKIAKTFITITIKDRGRGMDRREVEKLGTFTSKDDLVFNGTGYNTAKEIASRDFCGEIDTKSTKGKGTQTTIRLKIPTKPQNDRAHQP